MTGWTARKCAWHWTYHREHYRPWEATVPCPSPRLTGKPIIGDRMSSDWLKKGRRDNPSKNEANLYKQTTLPHVYIKGYTSLCVVTYSLFWLSEDPGDILHVLHDTVVHHTGIMLCHAGWRMTEHLRYILQGDIVSKGNSRRERVPGGMEGKK